MIAAAQRALAKPAGTANETEEKAMRRWLAGDLLSARGSNATQMTIVARGMTEAVKRAQRAAAQLRIPAIGKKVSSSWSATMQAEGKV